MKKICITALTLVLTASLLTGCRNRTQPMETTRPTAAPTTQATTAQTTEATKATTEATMPSETVDHGNGPLDGTGNIETTDNNDGVGSNGGNGGSGNGSGGTGSTGSSNSATTEGRATRTMPKN